MPVLFESFKNWSDFERKVVGIFELMRYAVIHDVQLASGQTDIFAKSSSPFNPDIVIKCKYHADPSAKVSVNEVENFVARVVRLRYDGIIDKGYLITNTGFTAHAKGSVLTSNVGRFVFLCTYQELLRRLIDYDFYLRKFVSSYESSAEMSRYIDLWIGEGLIDGTLRFDMSPGKLSTWRRNTDAKEVESFELRAVSSEWTKQASSTKVSRTDNSSGITETLNTLTWELAPALSLIRQQSETATGRTRLHVVLGEFGSGKSTLMRQMMYTLANRVLNNPTDYRNPIPLLINLRDYNKVVDFDSLLINFINTVLGQDKVSLPLFKQLNSLGHFVLLLDGFDEMASHVTSSQRRLMFREICGQVTANNQVIVSGRPGYFPTVQELTNVLWLGAEGEDAVSENAGSQIGEEIRIICLQLFDREQVVGLLNRRLFPADAKLSTVLSHIDRDVRFKELAKRPILANIMIETADQLAELNKNVTVRSLYELYTNRWVRAERDKGRFRLLIGEKEKAAFMGLLAVTMYLSDVLGIRQLWPVRSPC